MEKRESRNAFYIGTICVSLYVVNYFLRKVLSVLTPQMLETGLYSVTLIGSLSSAYMLFYALGQLVNGFLGDIVSPKRMVVTGIAAAGLVTLSFPFVHYEWLQLLIFAALGFALSMLRGPLMKIISENTTPNHARLICVFFSCASFAGPLIASVVAMVNNWVLSFVIAGVCAIVAAFVAYIVMTVMEKRSMINCNMSGWQGFSGLLSVFKIEKIIFYMVISGIVEIACSAIDFWIPTFLTDVWTFEKATANIIYSAISVMRAAMPFVALFIFRLINEKDLPMMGVSFAVSAVSFFAMLFSNNRYLGLGALAVALAAISCASALLWSIYIPSLGKTGKVSSVNGVIDCTGYALAAAANLLFAGVAEKIGWNGVIILWILLGLSGVIATIFASRKRKVI